MKKTIKKSQLEAVIRKLVMEALDPMDTVMKDSDELDHSNEYDNMRINQENDSAWQELDAINRKYSNNAYRTHPALSPDYNRNIENGHEEAEAYINMFESKTYNMVKRMVNETLKRKS